ncbi:MAG: T9SS type A sorting domain-containing protein [Saprospiraceae bacterium]|nr:T9SS type A sorting domain-containing protein [Saprospiraceae bacterium]
MKNAAPRSIIFIFLPFFFVGSLKAQLFEKVHLANNYVKFITPPNVLALSNGNYLISSKNLPYSYSRFFNSSGMPLSPQPGAVYAANLMLETPQGNILVTQHGFCLNTTEDFFSLFSPTANAYLWKEGQNNLGLHPYKGKLLAMCGEENFFWYGGNRLDKYRLSDASKVITYNIGNYDCTMMYPLVDSSEWVMAGASGIFKLTIADSTAYLQQLTNDSIAAMTPWLDGAVLALSKSGTFYEISDAGLSTLGSLSSNAVRIYNMVILNEQCFVFGYSQETNAQMPAIWKYDNTLNLADSTLFGSPTWYNLRMAAHDNQIVVVAVDRVSDFIFFQQRFPYFILKSFNTNLESFSDPRDIAIDNIEYNGLNQTRVNNCPGGFKVYNVKPDNVQITVSNRGTETIDSFSLVTENTRYLCSGMCGMVTQQCIKQSFTGLDLQPGESTTISPDYPGFNFVTGLAASPLAKRYNFFIILPDNKLDYTLFNNSFLSPEIATTIPDDELSTPQPSCFPNPAGEHLSIVGYPKTNQRVEVVIFNFAGQTIQSAAVNTDAEGRTQIDIGRLSPGMYWLKMEDLSLKFVKQ